MNELIGNLPVKEVVMSPFEWVLIGIAILDIILGAIWKTQRDKVEDGKFKDFVDATVKAAEFLSSKELLGTSKADFVSKAIAKKYPKADQEMIEILINKTLQAIDKEIKNK